MNPRKFFHPETITRYLPGVPGEIERQALETARTLMGSGYTLNYYASIASEFLWLYSAGLRDGKRPKRERAA